MYYIAKRQQTFLPTAAGTLLALDADFANIILVFSAATDDAVAIDTLGSSTSWRVLNDRAA
jgi:hypothetical protein